MVSLADIVTGVFTWDTLLEILVYAFLVLSLNLEYGWAGIPNFGKAGFIAIGAIAAVIVLNSFVLPRGYEYVAAHTPQVLERLQTLYGIENPLAVKVGDYEYSIVVNNIANPWLAASPWNTLEYIILSMAVAAVLGAIVAFLVSYPIVRLREDYLAIVLLMTGFLVWVILVNVQTLIGGTFGITLASGGFKVLDSPTYGKILFMIAATVLLFIYLELTLQSPFGRKVRATRDDEAAAEAMGKNVAGTRLTIILLGSVLSAIGGVLYTVVYFSNINPDMFRPDLTFLLIAMMLLGGAGNNLGAVVGVAALYLINRIAGGLAQPSLEALLGDPTLASSIAGYTQQIVAGLAILFVLFFRPRGLVPEGPVRTPAWRVLERLERQEQRRG